MLIKPLAHLLSKPNKLAFRKKKLNWLVCINIRLNGLRLKQALQAESLSERKNTFSNPNRKSCQHGIQGSKCKPPFHRQLCMTKCSRNEIRSIYKLKLLKKWHFKDENSPTIVYSTILEMQLVMHWSQYCQFINQWKYPVVT